MALETSCRSTLLTMSKEFSAIVIHLSVKELGQRRTRGELLNGSWLRQQLHQSEEALEVLGGLLAGFLAQHALQLADDPGCFYDVRRFIALTTVRNGSEVRTIRLDEEA